MPKPNITAHFVASVLCARLYPAPLPTTSFNNRTVLITGANTGLGLEAAIHFTRLNAARVIIACRNLTKAVVAKERVEKETGRTGVVEVWNLDLSSFASCMSFVAQMRALPRLDVAIMNAGLNNTTYKETEDGWEDTIQVNLISTTLLSLHTLAKQAETARTHPEDQTPRCVIVASSGHELTRFEQRNEPNVLKLLTRKEYMMDPENLWERYSLSKMLMMYCAREIAKLIPGAEKEDPEVVVNMVNPGLCHSELIRETGWGSALFLWIFAKSADQGGRALVDGVTQGKETHGEYLTYGKVEAPAAVITDDENAQKKMWKEVLGAVEEKYPGMVDEVLGQITEKGAVTW